MTADIMEKLPPQFAQLDPWLGWAKPTEGERHALRANSNLEELNKFCGALKPHMHELIQYLSSFVWGTELKPADENLYHLGLSYMEASIPLDLKWKGPLAQDSFPVSRLSIAERR